MKQIYGIDLAKDKFDVNFISNDGKEIDKIVKANLSSILKFLESLPTNVLLCGEYTGVHKNLLVHLASVFNVPIALVSGYEIKHSLSLLKRKSGSLDSKRIREYGERFINKIKLTVPDTEHMKELKELYALRGLLIKEKKC